MALLSKLAECASAGGVDFKRGVVFNSVILVNAVRTLSVGSCMDNCMPCKQSIFALTRVFLL